MLWREKCRVADQMIMKILQGDISHIRNLVITDYFDCQAGKGQENTWRTVCQWCLQEGQKVAHGPCKTNFW